MSRDVIHEGSTLWLESQSPEHVGNRVGVSGVPIHERLLTAIYDTRSGDGTAKIWEVPLPGASKNGAVFEELSSCKHPSLVSSRGSDVTSIEFNVGPLFSCDSCQLGRQ